MIITVVIQARMGSTRLPGKVLLQAGAPLLQRMTERVSAARTPTAVVIATTELTADDPICALARDLGVVCIRGHARRLRRRQVPEAYARAVRAQRPVGDRARRAVGRMTYLDYRHKIEFGAREYAAIDSYCRDRGVQWFASAWDEGAARWAGAASLAPRD